MTKVKFYIIDGEILAVFPEEIADGQFNMLCYAHIGQHSACCKAYLKGRKLAVYSEYYDLFCELVEQGYDDLHVINWEKRTIECHRNPTAYELKQGYGATHYRTFTIAEIGHNKKGEIKKRFKADDNLFYSTH